MSFQLEELIFRRMMEKGVSNKFASQHLSSFLVRIPRKSQRHQSGELGRRRIKEGDKRPTFSQPKSKWFSLE